jgi:transcriptional regulator with XRE-family HTH domain
MTKIDALQLFRDKCKDLGNARVARELGISDSAVSQIMHGKYSASTDNIMQRVVEVFGGIIIRCPVMGDIPLSTCADERRKPFAVVSGVYARQRRACKQCERRKP